MKVGNILPYTNKMIDIIEVEFMHDEIILYPKYTGTPENATHYADREIFMHEIIEDHIYLYIYKEFKII